MKARASRTLSSWLREIVSLLPLFSLATELLEKTTLLVLASLSLLQSSKFISLSKPKTDAREETYDHGQVMHSEIWAEGAEVGALFIRKRAQQ